MLAAEIGHLELAYDYLAESALVDLQDLHENTGAGLHLAALAGGWSALVAGFGGFRAVGGALSFAPRLPSDLTRFAFHLWYRQRCLRVSATPDEATYAVVSGDPLAISHHGEPLLVTGTIRSAGRSRRPCPAPVRPSRRAGRRPAGTHEPAPPIGSGRSPPPSPTG